MVYLVTWDLNKEGSSYSEARKELLDGINTFDVNYISSLDSVRFIATDNYTADELYRYLRTYIDDNDTLVVVKIEKGTSNHQGNIGKELWTWINDRIY